MALTAISTAQFSISCTIFPTVFWESCTKPSVDTETATYNDGINYVSESVAGNRKYPTITLSKAYDPILDPTQIIKVFEEFNYITAGNQHSILIRPEQVNNTTGGGTLVAGATQIKLEGVRPIGIILPEPDRNATEVARIAVQFVMTRLVVK
jgi:hypothetical protein